MFPDGNVIAEFPSVYEALQVHDPDFQFQDNYMEIHNMSTCEGTALNFMMVVDVSARDFEEMYLQVATTYGSPDTAGSRQDTYGVGKPEEPWWNHCMLNWEGTEWKGEDECYIEPGYEANMWNDENARYHLEKAIWRRGGSSRKSGPVHGDQIYWPRIGTKIYTQPDQPAKGESKGRNREPLYTRPDIKHNPSWRGQTHKISELGFTGNPDHVEVTGLTWKMQKFRLAPFAVLIAKVKV